MNDPHPQPPVDDADAGAIGIVHSPLTGLKIVVNGRTVVHRHFLQQAIDAMVRRAVAEESTPATA